MFDMLMEFIGGFFEGLLEAVVGDLLERRRKRGK